MYGKTNMEQILSSPFIKTPSIIVEQRKDVCNCNCGVDFDEPCAECPLKKWGPFYCHPVEEKKNTNENFPSIAKQASSFFEAVKNEAKSIVNGDLKISTELQNERIKICEECSFFDHKSNRCKKCGCFLKIKTAWRSQSCPIGKW